MDDIEQAIQDLENQLESDRQKWLKKRDSIKATDKMLRDLQKLRDDEQRELNELQQRGKSDKIRLEQLKIELEKSKLKDVLQSQFDAFKDKCLDSPWRKENRQDGKGAFPHQIEGAIHLAIAKQAILGDKMGLGKTLTSLIWLDLLEVKKAIILCPTDTMDNFIREVALWTPHRTAIKLGRLNKVARDFVLGALKNSEEFLLVVNYEAWRKDETLLPDLIGLKTEALICDEAQKAKTMKTKQGLGVQKLRFGLNHCPNCEQPMVKWDIHKGNDALCRSCGSVGPVTDFCSIKYVLPMTGTPILNKPQELFPQLRLIDPETFPTESRFLRAFCSQDVYNGKWSWQHKAQKKLSELVGPRFLARDRQAAGIIIPPSTTIDHIIEMDDLKENYPSQYKAYRQTKQYAQLMLDPSTNTVMSMPVWITVLLRLRQVLTWPAAIELKDQNSTVIARLNVHESAKLDKAEELIRDIIENGERVVLFSQFKGPLLELHSRLGDNSIVYDGSTDSATRNAIQLDFDVKTAPENPRWQAVLCNYKAAGEGLNFNSASQMVILDKYWNPGGQDQAHARINRIGQQQETTIHNITVTESIDEWLDRLIEEKRNLIEGIETELNIQQQMRDFLNRSE